MKPASQQNPTTLHASCVAVGNAAVLIMGTSGSGKSALALELMALGAALVADDRTIVTAGTDGLIASCPKPLIGIIEARFVGLLSAKPTRSAPVRLVVDLDQIETKRLPKARKIELLGHRIDLLHNPKILHFPSALLLLLKGGMIT
ncbi:MAG: HPr kinase/phosphatase C-terminal domain-containing protein [Paracoccaceae bacterium]